MALSSMEATLSARMRALVADRPRARLYTLVDGAMVAPTDEARFVMRESGRPLAPPKTSATADQQWALPWLVPMPLPTSDRAGTALAASLRWAQESDGATWIASSLDLSTLVDALRTRMLVQIDEHLSAVLRYSDARVLPVLAAVLNPEQRLDFFAPIDAWWYLDRAGELHGLDLPAVQGVSSAFALRLTDVQQAAMQDAAEPDAVASILLQESPEFLGMERSQRHEFLQRSIAAARQWNLQDTPALAQYGLLALELGEDFAQQPAWASWMAQVKEGRLTLAQAAEHSGL
jgi:hypothetical protein